MIRVVGGSAPRWRWALGFVVSVALVCAGLLTVPASADAAPGPVQPRESGAVTADALPTAQMNGVAWDQEVVGNTVFVGGNFSQARPAGAAPGASQTPRSNLMAYSLSSGTMTNWNPGANAQVRTVAASPDGSRVYVGGDFTQIAGQPRSRIAAFSTATGQLVGSFTPPVGYQVNDIAVTDSTVYVGGSFAGVGSESRANLAAFSASTGDLLGWAPSAERQVRTLDVTADGASVIIGGHFETVNGVAIRGLAKVDAVDGALEPWSTPISNAGDKAGVTSLRIDGNVLFGTSYHFGAGGNMEGPWQIDVATGELRWVADCHGDNYDAFPTEAALYTVGHEHYCGNVGMGFPQYSPWRYQHSMAWSREATGTNIREVYGYANWAGEPSPSIVSWLPSMSIGAFTGQYQAGWTVEGNDEYVVVGGEFPRVNNTGQQGLVRFATTPKAPQKRGPAFAGGSLVPTLEAVAPGDVKVSWPAGYDMDDHELTYQVVRSPGGIVATKTAASTWWDTPGLSHVDTGLTPGDNYSYSIRAKDPNGNTVFGATRNIEVPASFERDDYGAAVLADAPEIYWPLEESSGANRTSDQAGGYAGVPGSAVTFGVDGAVPGRKAVRVNNSDNGRIHAEGVAHAPTEMSAEVWFRTTAGSGRLLGFGDLQTGNSGHRDRQIYLADSGRVQFGVRAGGAKVVSSPQQYNDNGWHQAVATLSGSSARLYVDGVLVGQRQDLGEPEEYVGHWRLGGDNQAGWPNAGNNNFTGDMDEMSIYDHALSPAKINAHYVIGSGNVPNVAPTAKFTHTEDDLTLTLDATESADEDGEVATYEWDFGDGATGSGQSTSHTYAKGGTYDVALVVTDNDGASDTSTQEVTVKANQAPTASFTSQSTDLLASLDASASADADGTIESYTWDFGDGSAGSGVTTGHTYSEGGSYDVTLTVTDDDGSSEDTTETVTVSAPPVNEAPSAAFESTVTDLQVATDASSSGDTDGDIVSYGWDFGDGASGTGLTATHTYAEAGTFTLTLTVTDDDGDNDTTTQNVTVVAPPENQPPVAAFETSPVDLTVTVDGASSSDTDGTLESYAWDFGDGATAAEVGASHTYATAGTYDITLTVTDDDGGQASISESVTVTAPPVNQAPVAAFVPAVVALTATFDSGGTEDADGSIASYAWTFGDDETSTLANPTHTYAAAGTYEVTLTVTDDGGKTGSVTEQITVVVPPPDNEAPTADFTSATQGLSAQLDATGSTDSDGAIDSYSWDFGDGAGARGSTVSHTYDSAGSYRVTLTVVDDDGATAEATQDVRVTTPPGAQSFATDTFQRQVSNGFGQADLGGAWSTTNTSSLFGVDNGTGRMTMPRAGSGVTQSLGAVSAQDVEASVDLAFDRPSSATGIYGTLMVRRNGNDSYRLRARAMPTGTMVLLTKTVDGAETVLDNTTLPWVYQPGEVIRMRMTARGDGTTALTGKIWKVGDAEPVAGQVMADDATAALQAPGAVALFSYLSGSSTNAPVVASVDNLHVGTPGTQAPANVAPVAAFTALGDGLDLAVDAGASNDTDGSIESYDWDFGDQGSGTGTTAAHTYDAAGTYEVTLTVTDDQGEQDVASADATVSDRGDPAQPRVVAEDSFTRTETAGFGTADVGGTWAGSSGSSRVADGSGVIAMSTPGSGPRMVLSDVSAQDVDGTVRFTLDEEPTDGDVYVTLSTRRVGTSEYRLKARLQPGSSMLLLTRLIDGQQTTLSHATVPGMTFSQGDTFTMRVRTVGLDDTTLSGKMWRSGDAEPGDWQVKATDSAAVLQAPGAVGLAAYLSGAATNAPVAAGFDDLVLTDAAG